ncbi:hypothetical protein KKH26_01775 [Patescibacteria group bacterium]|nr:hypothetical protein [Patescibacteria group bacterium]
MMYQWTKRDELRRKVTNLQENLEIARRQDDKQTQNEILARIQVINLFLRQAA